MADETQVPTKTPAKWMAGELREIASWLDEIDGPNKGGVADRIAMTRFERESIRLGIELRATLGEELKRRKGQQSAPRDNAVPAATPTGTGDPFGSPYGLLGGARDWQGLENVLDRLTESEWCKFIDLAKVGLVKNDPLLLLKILTRRMVLDWALNGVEEEAVAIATHLSTTLAEEFSEFGLTVVAREDAE